MNENKIHLRNRARSRGYIPRRDVKTFSFHPRHSSYAEEALAIKTAPGFFIKHLWRERQGGKRGKYEPAAPAQNGSNETNVAADKEDPPVPLLVVGSGEVGGARGEDRHEVGVRRSRRAVGVCVCVFVCMCVCALECFKRATSPHLSRKWAAC